MPATMLSKREHHAHYIMYALPCAHVPAQHRPRQIPTLCVQSARRRDRTQTLQCAKARIQGAGGQLHTRKLVGTVEGHYLHSERLSIGPIVGDLLELLQGALTAVLVEILMHV